MESHPQASRGCGIRRRPVFLARLKPPFDFGWQSLLAGRSNFDLGRPSPSATPMLRLPETTETEEPWEDS